MAESRANESAPVRGRFRQSYLRFAVFRRFLVAFLVDFFALRAFFFAAMVVEKFSDLIIDPLARKIFIFVSRKIIFRARMFCMYYCARKIFL